MPITEETLRQRALGRRRQAENAKCVLRAVDGKAEVVDDVVKRLGPPITRSDVLRWHSAGSKTWVTLEARAAEVRRKRAQP